MEVKKVVSNILESNTFVLSENGKAVIVDCGAELKDVITAVGENKVIAILLTHEHYDHLFYVNEYIKHFNCAVYGSEETINFVKNPVWEDDGTLPRLNEFKVEYNSNFNVLNDMQVLNIENFNIKIIYCSGHSLGASCYIVNGAMFTGDVLFSTGIGRYDMIKNGKELTKKTLEKLQNVEDYNIVYCGHGEDSNIDKQKRNIRLFKAILNKN